MRRNTETALISGLGPFAAILLGMALVPFRETTSASNFTFLFLVLTILIAEYGGPRGAFATALCSALSLDFFLTQPYLQLSIKSAHDVVAFAGLSLCGFLVATFSSQRGEKTTELDSTRCQLDLLHSAVSALTDASQAEFQLRKLLDAACNCAPLANAALRDENNLVVAAIAEDSVSAVIPSQILSAYTLLPKGSDTESLQNTPFPKEGARVPLFLHNHQVGWMDLWGNGTPATTGIRRTLSDVTFLLAPLIATCGEGRRAPLQPAALR